MFNRLSKSGNKVYNVLALGALTSIYACTSRRDAISFREISDITYIQRENLELKGDLFLPKTPGPHPIVLVVHGGGWRSGRKESMLNISKHLASNGLAVFSINYRLSPQFKHPAHNEDLRDALRWIQKNAATYNLNASKIGLFGYSAGAHLVSLVALEETAKEKAEFPIAAVVAGGTPTDLSLWEKSPMVGAYLGKMRDEDLKLYHEASPLYRVHKKAPPFFLYHAGNDALVPYKHLEIFEEALKKAGAEVETYRVDVFGHITAFLFNSKSVQAGAEFLKKRLPTEKTLQR